MHWLKTGLGLTIGVISNLPADMTSRQLAELLAAADLTELITPHLIVTNHDAGADKPSPKIYEYARQRAGLAADQCLYIGENPDEVAGAAKAGMAAALKKLHRDK